MTNELTRIEDVLKVISNALHYRQTNKPSSCRDALHEAHKLITDILIDLPYDEWDAEDEGAN